MTGLGRKATTWFQAERIGGEVSDLKEQETLSNVPDL
jgi:hypothetical protein